MIKLLSCLLSFCIIFTSVTPSLASSAGGVKEGRARTTRTTKTRIRGKKVGGRGVRDTKNTLSRVRDARKARTTQGALSNREILNRTRPVLSVPHTSLLSERKYTPQAKQILALQEPQRALFIRSDLPILVLQQKVQAPEIAQALEFYRTELGSVEFPKDLTPTSIIEIANTAADVSSLGVMGSSVDAVLISEVYNKSIGTPAEPIMTAAAARALLRLEAYPELKKMSEKSTLQPEVWEGIADYVEVNDLPVEIAKFERTAVDVSQFQTVFKNLGDLNTWAATAEADATFFYMNAGRDVASLESQSLHASGSVVLPQGFELVEADPVRLANEQTQLFASEGDGVAHTGPVQAVRQAPVEQTVQTTPATATPTTTIPKYIPVETTNALGNTVTTWQLNPEYRATEQPASTGRQIGFLTRMRVKAGTTLMAARMFLTSRYGLLGLGIGATPLTAEAAVHNAPTVEVVEGVRAAQRGFTNVEEMRDASSGRARMEVNRGAVRAQQAAQQAAQATQATRTVAVASMTRAGANITRPVTLRRATNSGIAAMSLLPMPKSWLNWLTNSGDKLRKEANKQARYTLALVQPSATSLKAILESNASQDYKGEALYQLYTRGKLNSAINVLPQSAKDRLNSVKEDQEKLKEVLFSLYNSGSLQSAIDTLTDHAVQVNWEKDLEAILQDPLWAAKALNAYNNSTVLPSSDPGNFEGVVPAVPEVEQEKIISTFREAGFATENMAAPIDQKDVLYYPNRIPFYYRYADGTLSATPVGILSQESANLYGRTLSRLHLASQPGFKIPKGFVLALDESGQWKFLPAAGELSTIEHTPASAKIMEKIRTEGSYRVALDTPYTSSDLLSMANMLENKRDLNLELVLNTPHSLRQYLMFHAFFIGNDAGMSLAGPFTKMLKEIQGFGATMANGVSGVGYLTPWIAGWAMPLMTRLGNVKTIQYVYGTAAAALLASASMGLFWKEVSIGGPNGIPIGVLAVPTVAMVLGASLLNSFNNTLLNFFKDPKTRTSAHLSFAENKQWSRLALTGLTALAASMGGSWAVVVPVGLGLLAMSELLFLNTPIYKARAVTEQKENIDQQKHAEFMQLYKQQIGKLKEVKDIKFRVRMVYASYAASLMALSQGSTEILGPTVGPVMAAVFMLGTALTRKGASKAIDRNKLTDDQMTGVSLPLLATTGLALTLMPYSGPLAIATALVGILHYVATATPGQMDAARLQNIVSAEMQKQKAAVLDDKTLSPEVKKEKLAELAAQEKEWASKASKDYSYANGVGLAGITVAAVAAYLFRDLGPQWTQDILTFISSHTVGTTSDSLGLARIIFAYSAAMASVLALRNVSLFKDFMKLFHKQKITQENIDAGKINPSTFGMNEKNVALRLVNVKKDIDKLKNGMIEYGVSSEQKLTKCYQKLVEVYNRLVAAKNLPGGSELAALYMDNLVELMSRYEDVLARNDHSIMLQRAFEELRSRVFDADGKLRDSMQYMEEGVYGLPRDYSKYEEARDLVREIKQLILHDVYGGQVTADTYSNIITYYNRVQEALPAYKAANMADAPRVLALEEELNDILNGLKQKQQQLGVLDVQAGPTSPANVQALKDLLAGVK